MMPMTPQQLIDLPGAGMAEKQLRKDGLWELTAVEKLCGVMGRLEDLSDDITAERDAIDHIKNAKEAQCN